MYVAGPVCCVGVSGLTIPYLAARMIGNSSYISVANSVLSLTARPVTGQPPRYATVLSPLVYPFVLIHRGAARQTHTRRSITSLARCTRRRKSMWMARP